MLVAVGLLLQVNIKGRWYKMQEEPWPLRHLPWGSWRV